MKLSKNSWQEDPWKIMPNLVPKIKKILLQQSITSGIMARQEHTLLLLVILLMHFKATILEGSVKMAMDKTSN